MSKYKSKQQLAEEITTEKAKLDKLLANVDPKLQTTELVTGEWTTKDIICHLAKWQEMVLCWYADGLAGKATAVPHAKYKWNQLPELNQEIYLAYKDYSLEQAQAFFSKNEAGIIKLFEELTEDELLKTGLYAWMNKNALIAYIGSCTASHYKWAADLIKKKFK